MLNSANIYIYTEIEKYLFLNFTLKSTRQLIFGKRRMDSSETHTSVDTRDRTNTNKTIKHNTENLNDEHYGPIQNSPVQLRGSPRTCSTFL